ncbi:MAG: SGNH/GDSL hydrolase family protein [Microbacterium sp.]
MKRPALAALAALALSATALLGTSSAAVAAVPDGAPYVAVGDSIAAGTGSLPYTDASCLRSKKAYPELLGSMLGAAPVSAACAGATTTGVLQQLAALDVAGAIGADTQLVTVTSGANNTGWQNALAVCGGGDPVACQQALAAIADVSDLDADTFAVLTAIRAAAPNAVIAITGYPRLFGSTGGACTIGGYQGAPAKVTAQQAAIANSIVDGINLEIAQGLQGYQFVYAQTHGGMLDAVVPVDVSGAFTGHALCDTGDRWIGGLSSGNKSDGAFHPNAAGQQAYAAAVAAALAP